MRTGSLVCPLLVGRDAEVAELSAALDDAQRSRGCVAAITGEAGVGKTRLADEMARIATARGMRTLRGRGVDSAAPIPYRTLASALLPALRQSRADDTELREAAATLGLLGAGDAAASGDTRLLALEAAARMLRALAANAGLLLILDDVQWADSETLDVVDYLADTLDGERVLCLLTIRSDEPGHAGPLVDRLTVGARTTRMIVLDRLHEAAVDELARATLGAEAIPAGVAPILRARAEGLPLAAEQILADLVARHILTRAEDGRWTLRADTATTVPQGVRRLIKRRLDRLATTTRTVLACAALLGREFDWILLEVATGFDRTAVLAALGEATAAQLLDGGEHGSLAFRHALLRDGVLAAMAPQERKRLAARTALAVEASSDPPPPEVLELAAALRAEAGDRPAAAALLVRLGEDALRRGALASAAQTLARALDLSRGDAALGATAAELLIDALTRAGHHDEAIEVIRHLIDLLDRWRPLRRRLRGGASPTPVARRSTSRRGSVASTRSSPRFHPSSEGWRWPSFISCRSGECGRSWSSESSTA